MLDKRAKETPVTKLSRLDTASETRSDAVKVPRRAHNRLPKLLDEAARVFAKRGFAAASIREIVEPVGMLPGLSRCNTCIEAAEFPISLDVQPVNVRNGRPFEEATGEAPYLEAAGVTKSTIRWIGVNRQHAPSQELR